MIIPPLASLLPSIYKYGLRALLLAAFGGVCWLQGAHHEQLKTAKFEAATVALGEAAKQRAEQIAAADKLRKENADAENNRTITSLRADVKRLRDERSRSSYVPAAPAGSRSPEIACFNRADLERAIQQLDDRVSAMVARCDEGTVNLDTAKRWAQK
jgi:phospholipase/lecithinase/hemolysin